ncbi:conserved hypothetical protein [metagenome]|uniref:Sulfotransferase family protein n=1 Tax=metagenome TaxID=256318 RepID=A0A2P2CGC2_9ZZZZ
MTRRVFLHIGLPKTGTTYLQDVAWANKAALGKAGLLLPGAHQRRHLLASLDVRQDPALARRSGDVSQPWQDLVTEARAWPGDVLVSHEFFCAASASQVRRMVDDFPDAEVHVILTARAMVDLGISRWQEWVRNGGTQDIDSFPPRSTYDPTDEWGWGSSDLADVLGRWGEVVPAPRVHVLPMASGHGSSEELWVRFASVLGVESVRVRTERGTANRSMGVVETEVLRRINPHLTEFRSAGDRGRWIRSYLAMPDVIPATSERFRPGPETLADLARRGERALEILTAGEYDVAGDLALLTPSDVSGHRHPSEVSEAEMLDVSVRVVAALMGKVRGVTRERNELATVLGSQRRRVSVARIVSAIRSRFSRG